MTWISDLLDFLAGLPLPLVLVAVGVMAFSETAIGFGLVIPGETGVTVLSTIATTPPVFVAITVVVWLSASFGDTFGYLLGRRYGERIRDTKFVARAGGAQWDRTTDLLRRRGVVAVLIARFLPVVRVLSPIAAGTARMPYPRFLAASLTGALTWAVLHVAVGAFAGASVRYIEQFIGTAGWVVAGGLAAVAVGYLLRRRRRRSRTTGDQAEEQQATVPDRDQPVPQGGSSTPRG